MPARTDPGPLHRLTERDYTKASGSPTYPGTQGPGTFTYDRAGRMLSATRAYGSGNPSVEVDVRTLDAPPAAEAARSRRRPVRRGRTRRVKGRVTAWTTDSRAIAYAYTVDANTNRTEITYPGGRVIRFDLDQRDRATTIANIVSGSPSPTLATNTFDLANRQTHRAFGNSTWGDWTYDAAGRGPEKDRKRGHSTLLTDPTGPEYAVRLPMPAIFRRSQPLNAPIHHSRTPGALRIHDSRAEHPHPASRVPPHC